MKIYISSDHRGFECEGKLTEYLKEMGLNVINVDTNHTDTDDYTDFAFKLSEEVKKDNDSIGILLCGTGIGMSIAANKVKGIRAARCTSTEDAFYARNHNDANVICLGVNNTDIENIKEIIDTFISTKKAEEERHINRVNKIINYENGAYNEL